MEWNLSALNPQMITVFMQLVRTKPEDRDEKALKAATERAAKLWGILDKHLAKRPYVAGDRLTMGDIPLGVLVFRGRSEERRVGTQVVMSCRPRWSPSI